MRATVGAGAGLVSTTFGAASADTTPFEVIGTEVGFTKRKSVLVRTIPDMILPVVARFAPGRATGARCGITGGVALTVG
jgi:hypothetical protein